MKKSKREIAQELAKQGLTVSEVAKKMGEPYGNAYYWIKDCKKKRSVNKKVVKGWNEDRHGCKICKYRAEFKGCDYYMITDTERGCDPSVCDKFEKGDRVRGDGTINAVDRRK